MEQPYQISAMVSPPGYTDPQRVELVKAALQGLLANSEWVSDKIALALKECCSDPEDSAAWLKHELAEDAVEIADEVLKLLRETKSHGK